MLDVIIYVFTVQGMTQFGIRGILLTSNLGQQFNALANMLANMCVQVIELTECTWCSRKLK